MLYVKVLGSAGAGKTTLALAFKAFLEEQGIKVTVKDYDLDDSGQPEIALAERQAKRLAGLKAIGSFEIEIETLGMNRLGRILTSDEQTDEEDEPPVDPIGALFREARPGEGPFCPLCGALHEDPGSLGDGDGEESDILVECPTCHKTYFADRHVEPASWTTRRESV